MIPLSQIKNPHIMKTRLLHALLLCVTFAMYAQQNVWTGAIDDKWSDKDNWSGEVPAPSDDVLIPSGFVVTVDTPANILSLEVQGNSVLNVTSSILIQNPSEFEDNVIVNWSSGDLIGPGILLNSGTINMSYVSFDLSGSAVLNNPGTINMIGGAIGISSNSVLNNSGTGIIDFKTSGSQFGASSGDLINFGTIKTSFPNSTDEGFIACDIINQDGIFQIDSGTLNLNNTVVNSMGGEFNVLGEATLNLNSPMTISGILSGNVFGDLNWNDDLIVPATAFFNFSGNGIINCTGNLEGGGTLTNQTTINQIGGSALQVSEETTLDNEGLIQITSGPGIAIGLNSTVNNKVSGIIDLQVNGGNISSIGIVNPSILNNSGLIKASFPNQTDQSIFSAQLNNNNGTIQIDNGTLWLSNENTTLTNGVYNIATDAVLQWTQPITISGALNGNLDGKLGWEGDLLVPTTASFNFTGNGSVDWQTESLAGGGTLTNEHTITTISGANKIIDGATTLINNGEFRSSSFVRIGTNSNLTNSATGTIDIDTFGSSFGTINSAPHTFINSGLLVASFPTNSTVISAPLNNFGIIEVTTAEIDFTNTLVNETSGIIRGAGTIDLPNSANFINNGMFSPGLSPGILSVLGDYSSTSSSILNIELDGLTQGDEYDVLAINGNADLDGDIQITLGFSPDINDEFTFATVSGAINTCNLPPTVIASFGGFNYEFDFNCGANEDLLLTVVSETLSITDEELLNVSIYPNPTKDIVNISDEFVNNVMVFDINGRLVLKTDKATFSLKHLENGIYLVKAKNSIGQIINKKIIKQ